MDAAGGGDALLFAGWRYDPIAPALSRRDPAGRWSAVPLGSRALTILGLLIDQRGTVVSKDSIIRTVWPATTVEPNNLTVQIAALRRVLDEGRASESLIQTVPGQGYRLACSVAVEPHPGAVLEPPAPASDRRRRAVLLAMLSLALAGGALVWLVWRSIAPAPFAAMVSIEFEGADGPSSTLARDLADEVAADFNQIKLFETPRDVVVDPRPIATDTDQLRRSGARYALLGKLRRSDPVMRLDMRLVETQTGTQLWSQRLDIDPNLSAPGRTDAVRRIGSGMGPAVLTAELRRRRQEHPDQPTATDLVIEAILVSKLPPSPERLIKERDLYERALQLEPSSPLIEGKLAILLMDSEDYSPTGFKDVLERTRVLVTALRATNPLSEMALRTYAQWLHWQDDRCPEAIEAIRKLVDQYPGNVQGDRWLAQCLVITDQAEEALPWADRAIETATLSDSWQFANFRTKADVLLNLRRFKEAIAWYGRALAANPDIGHRTQSVRLLRIAAAQALDGDVGSARQTMASAQALWPFWTARGLTPNDPVSAMSPTQTPLLQAAVRLAGLRDHADEDADFGAAPIATLQQSATGDTSLTLPGTTTLRTADVARLVAAGGKMVIIDALSHPSGRSLPGAVGLRYVGAGGSLSDLAQDRLRETMRALTNGDLTVPILAVGWNSESFDGTNLALRLVALGYRDVLWYRGGREAWEASGGPETPLSTREW